MSLSRSDVLEPLGDGRVVLLERARILRRVTKCLIPLGLGETGPKRDKDNDNN